MSVFIAKSLTKRGFANAIKSPSEEQSTLDQAYPAFSRGESPGSAQKARKHWLEKFPPGPGVSVGLFSGPVLGTPGSCPKRAGNGPRRKTAARAICGPRHPRGVQSATGSSVRGYAAPQLTSRGRLPGAIPRSPRAQAA